MSVLPVQNEKVQLTLQAGDVWQNGLLMNGQNAVYATSSPVNYSNGIQRTASGAIFCVDATAGMPAGFTWSNGLPFSPLGALCISSGPVVTWSNGIPFTASGAVAAAFLPPAALDLNLTSGTLDSRVTFTRASGGTRFNSSGVLETVASDVPRFDHDPVTLAARGLLIEGARTNLVLNSATLATQNVTVTAVAHTLSFYGAGTVTLSGVATGSLVGSGAFPTRSTLTFTPTAGTLTLTVTGSVTLAQLEVGAFASSYIPTTSSQVTRAADVAVMTGTNFSSWYNQTEGTFFAELSTQNNTPNAWPTAVSVDPNAVQRGHSVGFANTPASLIRPASASRDASGLVEAASATISAGLNTKVAGVVSNDLRNVSANGQTVVSNTVVRTVPSVTHLRIGWSQLTLPSVDNFLFGHIRRIAYWNTRLTNAELQSLTS